MNYEVRITWDPRDSIFVARVPELQGVHSHGKTRAEAAKNVEEAIELHIETLKEDGEPIPVPLVEQEFSGKLNLRLGPGLHRDIAAKAAEDGKSINDVLTEAALAALGSSTARAALRASRKTKKRKAG